MDPFHPRDAFGASHPGLHEPPSLQLSPLLTNLFGVFAALPMAGVVGVAIYITSLLDPRHPPRLEDLLAPFIAIVAIAFLQIVLGIVVALLASERTDLTGSEKALWALGSIFVGSFGLPLFWYLILRKPMHRRLHPR